MLFKNVVLPSLVGGFTGIAICPVAVWAVFH
jgi:hypothetical protein